jgi:hypothetical protein
MFLTQELARQKQTRYGSMAVQVDQARRSGRAPSSIIMKNNHGYFLKYQEMFTQVLAMG